MNDIESDINDLEIEAKRVNRLMIELEKQGDYGSPQYEDLSRQLQEIDEEILGLEDELDRA